MRRELFAVSVAVAIAAACTPERPYEATFTFSANPLPPVPGQLVQYSFNASYVGLVEIYQGADLVGVVVNPGSEVASIHQFPAKSALVPRAIAYGVNGARIEVEATRGNLPPIPTDAGRPDADAGAPPESCPGSGDTTPDADAGTGCATFGGTVVLVKIRNDRPTQLWIYRDQWTTPPQPPCTFSPAGVVDPGATLELPVVDNGVLQFVDSATSAPLRYVKINQTPSCLLVARP